MANTTGKKFAGRQKGTPNKKTVEALSRAEKILQLIEKEYFEKDIKEISAGQRMSLYSDMLEYVSPKLSRQELTGSVKHVITVTVADE